MTTKEQVLAILLDQPDIFVSGQILAQNAAVSRNAIWKAITALRSEGYSIEAVTNRGYRLLGDREPVSEEGIRRYLRTDRFGRNMEVASVIDSTNARARELARTGAPEGTMVAARAQTNGRGRLGRRFHSPADVGIYISYVIRPEGKAADAVKMTALTAVAVARAIERIAPVNVGIKWVNDIFIGDRKVAGILCEAETDPKNGRIEYMIIGIGVNVSPCTFPEELRDIAGSIGNVCGYDISKNRLVAEICGSMEQCLFSAEFMEEYKARSIVPGHRVRVLDGDADYIAEAVCLDDDAALIVNTGFGMRKIRTGEIRIVKEQT